MAKFKYIPQHFLLKKLVEFWKNMVKNYGGDCHDDDFFDILCGSVPHGKVLDIIEMAYSGKEIHDMEHTRLRYGRLDLSDPIDDIFQTLWNNNKARGKCRIVLETLGDYVVHDLKVDDMDVLARRFKEVKSMLRLDDLELEILMLAYVRSQTCFSWPCRVDDHEKPLYYAMAVDRSFAEVTEAMSDKGRLFKYHLLDGEFDFNRQTLGAYMDGTAGDAVVRRFYRRCDLSGALPWEYYGELSARDGALIKRMLSAHAGRCNILLYGAPGTGKTSFACTLAKEAGRKAFEVKQGDDNGQNMKAEARMVGIQVCNEQEPPEDSIMIIDEADELLRGGCGPGSLGFDFGGRTTEKGVTNSILDDMKMPAIWISNAPMEAMDESVRRRFDYSICFERLNGTQRVSIWRNLVAKHGLGGLITGQMIEGYASRFETSAGGISTVLANVARMKPAASEVDDLVSALMKQHCRLMGVKEGGEFLPARDYSLAGLNIKGKVSPAMVLDAVRNYLDAGFGGGVDRPRMNILLFGPPGTGKTEYVRYLGRALDRKVMVTRGSDILSKWVGEGEQNIANAFRRAEAEHAILFFDEVDGLLQDRSGARAGWEVTQVNELLQQMESFDGVMVAATNFSANLDPATMRRFTFKLEFRHLDDAGKRAFFERTFGAKLSEEEAGELFAIRNLAPGDFRTVRQELFYLGSRASNLARIEALKEECALKKDRGDSAQIGFADR